MKKDIDYLRQTLKVAERSHTNGNLPFGCILVDKNGNVIEEGLNTVHTDLNPIAHCEMNLLNKLPGRYSNDYLLDCTMYASTEPCPMCAAALYWAGIGRLVFALQKEKFHEVTHTTDPAYKLELSAKEVLLKGGREVIVEEPLLEEEATKFYQEIFKR